MSKTLFCVIALRFAMHAMAGEPTASFADFDRRARAGERLNVVFFGASLTWGSNATNPMTTSCRARVADMLEAKYPKAHFKFVDGAIGGTGSDLGVFRLQRDCLAHDPDLAFLDFSANDDIYRAGPKELATYESLARRIVTEGKCPLVIVIFPFKWNSRPGTAKAMPGRLAHLRIAQAYQVPVGDAIVHIQNLTAADEAIPERVWNVDPVHPGDFGYRKFADAAWHGFMTGAEKRMVCRAPEKMLHADTYMTWSRNRLSRLKQLPEGWQVGLVSRTSAWFDGLMSRWLDDVVIARNLKIHGDPQTKRDVRTPLLVKPITVNFKAGSVLVFGEETIKSGKYLAFIDGKPVTRMQAGKEVTEFDLSSKQMGGGRQHYAMLATGLDLNAVHTLEIRPLFADDGLQELRLESIGLAGGEARLIEGNGKHE